MWCSWNCLVTGTERDLLRYKAPIGLVSKARICQSFGVSIAIKSSRHVVCTIGVFVTHGERSKLGRGINGLAGGAWPGVHVPTYYGRTAYTEAMLVHNVVATSPLQCDIVWLSHLRLKATLHLPCCHTDAVCFIHSSSVTSGLIRRPIHRVKQSDGLHNIIAIVLLAGINIW